MPNPHLSPAVAFLVETAKKAGLKQGQIKRLLEAGREGTDRVTQKATEDRARITSLERELHATLMVAGDLSEKSRKYVQAEAAFSRAGLLAPDDAIATFCLGRVQAAQGKLDDTLASLRKAAERLPHNRDVALWLAGLQVNMGDLAAGRASLADHYLKNPLRVAEGTAPDLPPIILARGFSRSLPLLGENSDGVLAPGLRGGSFSHIHLLTDPAFTLYDYTIAGGNILEDPERDPPRLPEDALVVNTIADPDIEDETLEDLEAYLVQTGLPVVNSPAAVRETTRDNNYDRLKDLEGIVFPRTTRIEVSDPESSADELRRLGYDAPFILREAGTHSARSTKLIEAWDDVAPYLTVETRRNNPMSPHDEHGAFTGGLADTFYAIQYFDIRRDDGFYNKKRFFVIDGDLYPVVSHLDRIWNVRGTNRLDLMKNTPWAMDQERAFLEDPEASIGAKNYRRLHDLKDIIGLDFFGIDFTDLPDGRILIFETNPAMRHSHDHGRNFPYMTPHLNRITEAFETMVRNRLVGLQRQGDRRRAGTPSPSPAGGS